MTNGPISVPVENPTAILSPTSELTPGRFISIAEKNHNFSNRRDTGPSPDEIPLVFSRMDRPDDEPPPPAAPISTKTSLLTLLLVVVPLSVGAATVLVCFSPPFSNDSIQVVAFNYYCHLC